MLNAAPTTADIALTHRTRNRDAKWIRMFRVEAWITQGHKCAYCHEPLSRDEATADHAKPIISGGATKRENIRAACLPCNKAKANLSEGTFLKIIKSPPPGSTIHIWFAHARRRIFLRMERACKRIERSVT